MRCLSGPDVVERSGSHHPHAVGQSGLDAEHLSAKELNVELHDPRFARWIGSIAGSDRQLTLAELDGDPLPLRLRNSAARLLQPYL